MKNKLKNRLTRKKIAVKPRKAVKKLPGQQRNKRRTPAKQVFRSTEQRYALNPNFEFFPELKGLILKASPAEKDLLIKKILTLGRVKLAVVSGIFLNTDTASTGSAPVDLFIVGDDISRDKLRAFLRSLEAEIGREIKFGLMDKDEFDYRYGMFDRFIRVLMEGPHEKIINKIGI